MDAATASATTASQRLNQFVDVVCVPSRKNIFIDVLKKIWFGHYCQFVCITKRDATPVAGEALSPRHCVISLIPPAPHCVISQTRAYIVAVEVESTYRRDNDAVATAGGSHGWTQQTHACLQCDMYTAMLVLLEEAMTRRSGPMHAYNVT